MNQDVATAQTPGTRDEQPGEPLPFPSRFLFAGPATEESERAATILMVEEKEINRHDLRAMLQREGYRMIEATRAAEAFSVLEREPVDLIILGLMLPEIGGLEFCREVKSRQRTRLIPVLVLTSVLGTDIEAAGLAAGADEYLVRPLQPSIVRTRLRSMLLHKAAIDSLEEAESTLFALAQAIEHRDKCTGNHCERLAFTSMLLGSALGLPRAQLLALHRGGFLHDIGKVAIPDAVLFKPGPLTADEWEIMRTHTIRGEEICRPVRALASVLPIIRGHHERWDGTGYPDGLSGEAIPLVARILQVADVYDALTSARPYRAALSPAEALEMLDDEARRGWREPRLVALVHWFVETPFDECTRQVLGAWFPADATLSSLDSMRLALQK